MLQFPCFFPEFAPHGFSSQKTFALLQFVFHEKKSILAYLARITLPFSSILVSVSVHVLLKDDKFCSFLAKLIHLSFGWSFWSLLQKFPSLSFWVILSDHTQNIRFISNAIFLHWIKFPCDHIILAVSSDFFHAQCQ